MPPHSHKHLQIRDKMSLRKESPQTQGRTEKRKSRLRHPFVIQTKLRDRKNAPEENLLFRNRMNDLAESLGEWFGSFVVRKGYRLVHLEFPG
ncbi:hypothetical protein CDAR_390501 [Caerostris darwini]|uniref:Uncharacterized protein n=1 Tax=Caerostris darwini TaxID=1538125 RepID=A0AAV4P164_9ARAC|nr:hypothetical protein CDAR_390501 [Caerostris darwini]